MQCMEEVTLLISHLAKVSSRSYKIVMQSKL